MSKRPSSSQNTIDTIIKINFNLSRKIITQLRSFDLSKNEYLLEQLEQLLEFKGKKIKNESSSNIYSEITIFQIKKIMNVLCKLEFHHRIQNSDNDLNLKTNKLKGEVINDLKELDFDYEINENIEKDILEDTDLNYDNNTINDEQINDEQINDEQINELNHNNKSIDEEDTNLNYDYCDNDIINDEPINESNYNNESIDESINKSTNNNNEFIGGPNNESNYNNEPINNEPINNEPINNEPINNEPINNEPINNEPINNEPINKLIDETIDPTIKKSTNNEKTINKPTNNDKIIEDLFPLVFEYLSINDLINCRLVNKQFKKLSDNTNGVNKLIIGEPNLDFDDFYWFYNNTPIEDKDIISLKCFSTIKSLSIFNLDKNLKYLKIYDSQFQLTEISNLINLESLEFGHLYHNKQQILNSNNLKFLALNNKFVKLTTPKLEKIQLLDSKYFRLISNEESIKHLITINYHLRKLIIFKNLEIFELRDMESYKTINENLLIKLKNLKQLKINLNLNKVKYSEERIKKSLIKILTDKIELKKEIDIYLEGIKIENINKFNELFNIDRRSYWKFALDNYDLLDSNIPFIGTLNYYDIEKCFNNPINDLPTSFFNKFQSIEKLLIFNTKNVDGLKWFIINLKHLTSLTIGLRVSLGQDFYDNIPNTIRFLNIHTKEDINYKFILKLSKLIKFETEVHKDLFNLAFTSFLNLKYLKYFRFNFNGKKIEIEKENDYFYLNNVETKLNYNQLIEECNKIKSN